MKIGRFEMVKKSEIKEGVNHDTSFSDEIFAGIKGKEQKTEFQMFDGITKNSKSDPLGQLDSRKWAEGLINNNSQNIEAKKPEEIKHITLRYTDTIVNMEIPDGITATLSTLYENRKVVSPEYGEYISGRPVTVILIAPKDIDTGKIIESIDDVLNPVKVSVKDLKFQSTDELYNKWLRDKLNKQ